MADAARSGFGPAGRALIVIAAAAIAIVALHLAREFVAPIVFAAVIVIIVHPLRGRMQRAGAPSWLATAVVIATAYLILAVLGLALWVALAQFVSLVPDYAAELSGALDAGVTGLTDLGFDRATLEGAVAGLDPEALRQAAVATATTLLGWVVAFVLVLAYILFAAVDAARFHDIAVRFADSHGHLITALRDFASGVRRYMIVNAAFGVVVAVLDGALLAIVGVPGALVWAVLAFVTNFIPNIGFVIGVIPPVLLALVTGGWGAALIVLAGYCVINFTLQELVQPKFVSDAVDLSLTLTFASVIFWTVVLGPVGAILSIPMTLFVRAILLDADPRAAWARALVGSSRVRGPST